MEGQRVLYSGCCSNMTSVNFLQTQKLSSSQSGASLFLSGSSSSSFPGSGSMFSFEDVSGGKRSKRSFFHAFDRGENGDEDLDEYFHYNEKKRRLTADQVQFLEKSFEVENKLEPDRKVQLAKDLGLQPRQVAIWFQNRRARWKSKQLEKDYETLNASYNSLKADYGSLLKEQEKLKAEVLHLADRLRLKERNTENSELSDTKKLSEPPCNEPIAESISEDEVSKVSVVACKQEDLSSAKSDVFDSDSPHYTDGVHSSVLEPGDSSHVFELDQSDLYQEEENDLSKSLLPPPPYSYLKIDEARYSDPPANSYYFGFPVEDHAFNFWSY